MNQFVMVFVAGYGATPGTMFMLLVLAPVFVVVPLMVTVKGRPDWAMTISLTCQPPIRYLLRKDGVAQERLAWAEWKLVGDIQAGAAAEIIVGIAVIRVDGYLASLLIFE